LGVFELTPVLGVRLLDRAQDLARWFGGLAAAPVAARWRWVCLSICVLGEAAPILASLGAHPRAKGGVEQFAPATRTRYGRLRLRLVEWLEVWFKFCFSAWLNVCMLLLWYASL
jgi:hypothetical protein